MCAYFHTLKLSNPRFESNDLRHITVKSPALQHRGDISVYLPQAALGKKNVPLVILLHGVYGSHLDWPMQAGAHYTAGKLIEKGKIRPMVIAMPSDGLLGDGSGYLPHAVGDYEAWIVKDVPQAVQECFPELSKKSPCFLSGLSMGGYGTLRLGAKYGASFSGLSAHSAITNMDELQSFIEEDTTQWGFSVDQTEVFATIMGHLPTLPPFRFDCGTEDHLLSGNRKLHVLLKENDVPHQYEEFPGGHEWPYWEEHLVDSLLFFEGILAGKQS